VTWSSRRGALAAGVGLVAVAVGSPLAGQARPARPAQPDRCRLELVNADRRGAQTTPSPGITNFFAGGNVHGRCVGRNIHIYADSMASYGGTVVQFLSQTKRVRYRDSTTNLDADIITYFRDNERVEAQGNVVHKDLKAGSSITGPRVDYFRPLKNVRPEFELLAYNRPTIKYVVLDSLGKPSDPYTIVGNQVKTSGSNLVYAGGNVTIDRHDLHGTADSIWLDSGKAERGQMLRNAKLESVTDSGFVLTGATIDLGLAKKELSSVEAKVKAKLVSKEVILDADSILILLTARKVEQTRAWGSDTKPVAVSSDYRITGDSLVIETPGQRLTSVSAFGSGWAGLAGGGNDTAPDSGQAASTRRRDWIAGERVVATFVARDSAGATKTSIKQLEAEDKARSFYQMAAERGQARGSINYTRADRIVVFMRLTSDSTTVDRVESFGSVDGVHLQPAVRRDTTARRDTTVVRGGNRP
jgi:hypothetical protein